MQDAILYIQLLMKVLDKISIMLEDFELLLKLKWKGNTEFYLEKSQTEEEALEELKRFFKSSPDSLQNYMIPVKKAIYAIRT